jgi:mycothiol synthase
VRFRAPVAEDAPAVLAVLRARELADVGVADYRLESLRDEWRSAEFDLGADARVVESADGTIVAYAAVRHPGTLAVASPDHEGRGIGSRLLEWAERRERELGRVCHRQWIGSGNARGEALLRAAGYAPVRSYWRMVRGLTIADGQAGPPPPAIVMRSLELDRDAAALHALDAESFAANADYQPESLEIFREEHLHAHDLDPGLSLVAELDGRAAGFLLARRWDDDAVGYIDLLAVHPAHQRRGVGTALLQTAFAGFASGGLREAQLGVASDNPHALGLYERVGMRPRFRFDTYERPTGVA